MKYLLEFPYHLNCFVIIAELNLHTRRLKLSEMKLAVLKQQVRDSLSLYI